MDPAIRNQDVYERLVAHPLVLHLMGKLWHATSLENYQRILSDGCLLPNDGSRVGVYKRVAPRLTTCEKLDAISLFDFDQPHDRIFPLTMATETIKEYFLEWSRFLWWYDFLTIILVPNRAQVGTNIAAPEVCQKMGGQWIYNVEVCHRGAIPLAAIGETIVVCSGGPRRGAFKTFGGPVGDDELCRLLEEWFPVEG